VVLLLELAQVAQDHRVLRQKQKRKKIQVGLLSVALMMMVQNGLRMKMKLGTTENQVKPTGFLGKIR
jgi:hypothetical protein